MKRKFFLVQLIIFVGIITACSNQDSKTEIPATTDITVSENKIEDSAQYIWQNWANTLQMEDIDHIDLISDDKQFPYATYCGEELQPVVELIHSIDGSFADEVILSTAKDSNPAALYVFMNDGTRHTIQKITGEECNYIIVNDSAFTCDEALFNRFPDIGNNDLPNNYSNAGLPPKEKTPKEQRSHIRNNTSETNALPTPEGYETYDWMVGLRAEDVDYIEFVNLNEEKTPYRRYEGIEIQEIIDLFRENQCFAYSNEAQWPGYFNTEFYIVMKDGFTHTVSSIGSIYTVIDGAAYSTISDWLNNKWPETGNAPLPDNWVDSVSNRNFYHVKEEKSVLSTWAHDAQRAALDDEYDSSREMGSLSRSYPIGRGIVTLSAQEVTSNGVTIRSLWSAPSISEPLSVSRDYWLEQWIEGTQRYVVIAEDIKGTEDEQVIPMNLRYSWDVNWQDAHILLEPGHYRIGMTLYETLHTQKQNETICYVKFSVA